ncbi:MAG: hypothetical protein GXP41_02705, partial [Chloroflexi bacterium]|nr:hypothetical protein [Chloroflexota bacterium]
IAMEYYLGILNRTYRVFITPNVVAGAFVRGIMAAPLIPPRNWFDPTSWIRRKLDEKYKHADPESESFVRKAPFNFRYQKSDIRQLRYDPSPKWGMGSVAHSGKLYIEINSGKTREFVLLGLQQGKEILEEINSRSSYRNSNPNDIELRNLLEKAFDQPNNQEIWFQLTDLFEKTGEVAQAGYCRGHALRLG